MGIKALGYVIVETAQPERWDTFLTQLAGVMRAPDAADGALQFRIDDRPFRFRIEKSDREWFKAAGYEVADAAELDALAARVAAAGHKVERFPFWSRLEILRVGVIAGLAIVPVSVAAIDAPSPKAKPVPVTRDVKAEAGAGRLVSTRQIAFDVRALDMTAVGDREPETAR